MSRREWFLVTAAGASALASSASGSQTPVSDERFWFGHDHILGTSLDLCITAPSQAVAERAEQAALTEIERLRQVFSLYDPTSELSRLNESIEPTAVSADLFAVLRTYETWHPQLLGACSPQTGLLVNTWRDSEAAGELPDPRQLLAIAECIQTTEWKIDPVSQVVTRCDDLPFNLNAAAKGYIIERAADAIRRAEPRVTGLLVNIGGDMMVWGPSPLRIGLQNPLYPEENSRPISSVALRNASIATSGGYQRYYRFGSQRFSHLIDPRNGQPASAVVSATVIGSDSMTANLLATTFAVMQPHESLPIVDSLQGVECLLVLADGQELRSAGFAAFETPVVDDEPAKKTPSEKPANTEAPKGPAWPDNFQVNVAIELIRPTGGKVRRPYVCIWVEDSTGKPVRTVAVWGNSSKWIRDMTNWWRFAKDDSALFKAVSRATRGPGKYDVVWDGKDDQGKPLPQGTYTIKVEVHRERGGHHTQTGKIECLTKPAKITMDRNSEAEATVVEFRKKG